MSAGGGSKRLFRKIDNKSSEFYPTVNEVRLEGSFIYEEFVHTQVSKDERLLLNLHTSLWHFSLISLCVFNNHIKYYMNIHRVLMLRCIQWVPITATQKQERVLLWMDVLTGTA
jgi:hypothetical protein